MVDKYDVIKQIAKIVCAFKEIQKEPEPHRLVAPNSFPIIISGGSKGSFLITPEIDSEISHLALVLKRGNKSLDRTVTDNEWRTHIRTLIGLELADIDLQRKSRDSAEIIFGNLISQIKDIQTKQGPKEYVFGCSLFQGVEEPFSIGEVQFEHRDSWLKRKYEDGDVSKVSRRRIERAWSGSKPRNRTHRRDQMKEDGILKALGNSHYVCTVSTNGLTLDAGREQALIAARIATTIIALHWRVPSKALSGINLMHDRILQIRYDLVFMPDNRVFLGGFKALPFALGIKSGEWHSVLADGMVSTVEAGSIIDFVVDLSVPHKKPKLANILAQALLWFHEGCRAPTSLVAVVNFVACLDGLACGTHEKGILSLLRARLGLDADVRLYQEGPVLKDVIKDLYGNGRSRAIHGTSELFGHDLTRMRGIAEEIARLALIACINWIAEHPDEQHPRSLRI